MHDPRFKNWQPSCYSTLHMEGYHVKLTLAAGLFVAASAAAFAQAPQGASQQPGPATPRGSATQGDAAVGGERTLTGCLTSAENIYTLTVLDDSGTPGSTAETIAYTLAPGSGVELRAYLNRRVTVKGTDAGQDAAASSRVEMKTPPAPAATGTSGRTGSAAGDAGGVTPKVETSAKTRITSRTFNVTNVQPATGGAGSCGA